MRRIFDIIFAHHIPNCWIAWASEHLRKGLWQLRAIPFRSVDCRVVETERWGVHHYECGYENRGNPAYRGRSLKNGSHDNLHPIIHLLYDAGVKPEAIHLEEKFYGVYVDVLAEIEDSYIVVELGSLNSIGRFSFADMDCVKAFWFGDYFDGKKGFIYSLSKRQVWDSATKLADVQNYNQFIVDYLRRNCGRHQLDCDIYSALDCRDSLAMLS